MSSSPYSGSSSFLRRCHSKNAQECETRRLRPRLSSIRKKEEQSQKAKDRTESASATTSPPSTRTGSSGSDDRNSAAGSSCGSSTTVTGYRGAAVSPVMGRAVIISTERQPRKREYEDDKDCVVLAAATTTTTTTSSEGGDVDEPNSPRKKAKTRRLPLTTSASTTIAETKKNNVKSKPSRQRACKTNEDFPVLSTTAIRYNLRSTRARNTRAVATVTPRQINFDRVEALTTPQLPGKINHQRQQSHVKKLSLPKGVVDIYGFPQHTNRRGGGIQQCRCPVDHNFLLDTRTAVKHLITYGREFTQTLYKQEKRQIVDTFGNQAMGPYRYKHVVMEMDDWFRDEEEDPVYDWREPDDVYYVTKLRYRKRSIPINQVRTSEIDGASYTLPRQPKLTAKMRAVLVNWMVELGAEYSLSDATFHLSVSLLDAVLAKGPDAGEFYRDSRHEKEHRELFQIEDTDDEESEQRKPIGFFYRFEFQALGCACTWIASKLEDKTPPKAKDFVFISDSSFAESKLRSLEQRIVRRLNFHLHLVTPLHFVNQFLRASHACPCGGSCEFDHPVLRQTTLYLLELARVPFDLSYRPPSLIAAAAVYLARATLGMRDAITGHIWTPTLAHTTKYKAEDLCDTVLILHKYQMVAERADTTIAMWTKYRKLDKLGVARKPAPRMDSFVDFTQVQFLHEDLMFVYDDDGM